MGLLERVAEDRGFKAESRVIGGVPWRPWDNPFVRFDVGGPVHPSRAFYGVDEALRLVPVYAAVRLIAEYIASLPVKMYLKDPSSGRVRRYNGPSIFDDPAPTVNVMDWLYECLTSLLLQGNAWGFVLSRDGFGFPQQISWMPPEMVTVIDDETMPFNPLRSRVYFYGRLMNREEYFHIRAFSLPGRTEGISPLRAFALTILNGLESTRYGTDWFKSGGFPPGTFKNSELEIDASQSAEIRALLTSSIRRREPLVYGRDWDYHPVVVPPSEAQFIEAMQMNATQIAAVYGLPPDRVSGKRGDSLTYSTVEQGALQIIEALRPWLVRLETAFFSILPANRFCRFNADALLKTDLQTRANIYKVWRDIGLRSVDEMRDIEDLEPLPNGIGADNIPLDAIIGMSRSTRAVPNSILPQVTLEARLALEYLEELQGVPGATMAGAGPAGQGAGGGEDVPSGPVTPNPAGPAPFQAQNPATYLANTVAAARGGQISLAQFEEMITAVVRRVMAKEADGPEFVGPWIPDRRDLVLNGNGRR
jgi:HK97 family phage portal protein